MEWTAVESSAIRALKYEPASRELYVDFHNRRRYVYFDVPQAVFEQFASAPSIGRYFAAHVRNVFRFRRIA